MSTEPRSLEELVHRATGRAGLVALVAELGVAPAVSEVPRPAWSAYGLGGAAGVRRLVVIGRSGSMEALLLELDADAPGGSLEAHARAIRRRNPARLHLFACAWPGYARCGLGVFGLDDAFRQIVLEPASVRASDVAVLEEMRPAQGESGLELAVRFSGALDRSRVTGRFFRDFSARRASLAVAWRGIPPEDGRERAQLALLFLCRLTFLYFIQRRGALGGDARYLVKLYGSWAGAGHRDGFYRERLVPLFFRALNRPSSERDAAALALGPLPYLNGGLFEPHALERRYTECALPDAEIRGVLEDFLERYRFSPMESGGPGGDGESAAVGRGGGVGEGGVDPEILGRVFEGLMAPGERGDTGSFYTPAPVVHRLVREAVVEYLAGDCPREQAAAAADGDGARLPAAARRSLASRLERVRVLDPACGSGAFLLGALARLTEAVAGVSGRPSGAVRREIVARSLHGVDLLDDAALLCSLRLWLALTGDDDEVRPLPNLDRRIRQGDALVDPLDLGGLDDAGIDDAPPFEPLRDVGIRRGIRAVEAAGGRYVGSGPGERDVLRAQLADAERRLAGHWVRAARAAHVDRLRRLRARARDRDLFGDRPTSARRAEKGLAAMEERLREVETVSRALEEDGAVPFFSFGVHFADGGRGFDVILSNPPWVRSHRWPGRLRRLAARRYEVCRSAGWPMGTELTGAPAGAGAQVDLALLFVERALRLLAPGGVLAVVLPAKAFRALYGATARRILLRDLEFCSIEDHALDQRSIFRADAFAGVLIGRRPPEPARPRPRDPVRIRMVRRGVAPLEFGAQREDLPLFPDDPASPWIIAPPDVVAGLRAMQRAGPPLGRHSGLRVRRGVMTGANDALVLTRAEPKLGGLARVEAEGHGRARRAGDSGRSAGRFRAVIETDSVRPMVRGADIDAFRYRTAGYLIWCHDGRGAPVEPGERCRRYLERHRAALEARQGWRPGLPLGTVFRLGPDTLGPKVAWHDLSDTLRAVALPDRVPFDGRMRELVPLNTLYFLPVPDHERAILLAGILNSLPARIFARAIAERAKDARFRFFAWTVSCLPLPDGWTAHPSIPAIRAISAAAHDAGGIDEHGQRELDQAVAGLYGLDPSTTAAFRRFDRWLRGEG